MPLQQLYQLILTYVVYQDRSKAAVGSCLSQGQAGNLLGRAEGLGWLLRTRRGQFSIARSSALMLANANRATKQTVRGVPTDPWLCTHQERNGSMLKESVGKRHLYYTFPLIAPLLRSSCLCKIANNATLLKKTNNSFNFRKANRELKAKNTINTFLI